MNFSASSFCGCQLLNINMQGHSFECSLHLGVYLFKYAQPQSLQTKTRFLYLSAAPDYYCLRIPCASISISPQPAKLFYSLHVLYISLEIDQTRNMNNIYQKFLVSFCLILRSINRQRQERLLKGVFTYQLIPIFENF